MKIALAHGCFDIVHIGHLRQFQWVKENLNCELVVSITPDKYITKQNAPLNNQDKRMELLKQIKWIDRVVMYDDTTGKTALDAIKPDYYIKGYDWVNQLATEEANICEMIKCAIIFISLSDDRSSTLRNSLCKNI